MATSLRDSGAIWIEERFLPDSEALFDRLATAIVWDERIRARKAASFGVPYDYSGITWPAAPFPDLLTPVLERVAEQLGYRPNNCLANYYPDHTSTMGFHSDAVDGLAAGTGIAVVSLGAEREITFRSQSDKQIQERYCLPSGSLLFMTLAMQSTWKHAILKADATVGGRISLTFRLMQALDGQSNSSRTSCGTPPS